MANGIRWGLLSTARINRALIPPIKSLPRHSLRAVASRDAARAKAYAADAIRLASPCERLPLKPTANDEDQGSVRARRRASPERPPT